MTFIVNSSKHKYLAADRYVYSSNDDNPFPVSSTQLLYEKKIKISEDGHFAYVCDLGQRDDLATIIMGVIYRHETNQMVESDKELHKITNYKSNGRKEIYFMTRRFNYYVVIKNDAVCINQFIDRTMVNILGIMPILDIFDFTPKEMFDIAFEANVTLMTREFDIVYAKDLKLITKKRKA